ncbi:MAG: ABC transporter permease [Candidatus Methylomirabilia bacterium]
MSLWASARIAVRALWVNKLRSGLTMLGIIIGVGAVITMVAVGTGARARVAEQIQNLGSNVILAISGTTTSGGVRLGHGSRVALTEDDAWAIQREIPGVEAAAPSMRGAAQVVAGNLNWSTVIYGVTPEYFPVRNWEIIAGRLFIQQDVDGASKVALLGQTVVEMLFGDSDPLGQIIRIQKVPFTIIGILEQKGQNPWGRDQDDVILLPLSTAKKRVLGVSLADARAVGAISIKARPGSHVEQTQAEIGTLLRQRHRLQPHQDDDFWLRNLSEFLEAREESSRVLAILLAAIASVSLLVGGIGIMNIMLVSVTERTREIGLRMAVGARSGDILAQFLVEAVILSLTGGLIGISLGVAASYGFAYLAAWHTLIQPEAILLAFAFSGAVGTFFGFYPARKASRLDPVEALRYE